MDEKKDSDVEQKPKQDVIPVKRKVNGTGEKTEKELKEAKVLLEELKEQRDEQKKLLDAQRELINELKQHQKEAHPNIQVTNEFSLVTIRKGHHLLLNFFAIFAHNRHILGPILVPSFESV